MRRRSRCQTGRWFATEAIDEMLIAWKELAPRDKLAPDESAALIAYADLLSQRRNFTDGAAGRAACRRARSWAMPMRRPR